MELLGKRVALPYENVSDALNGKAVIFGVRPEHVSLGERGIPATVDVCELMGSSVNLHLAAGGTEVEAVLPSSEADMYTDAFSQVYLNFDMEQLHFFDAETENRIEL